jgi:hypothetical protein
VNPGIANIAEIANIAGTDFGSRVISDPHHRNRGNRGNLGNLGNLGGLPFIP